MSDSEQKARFKDLVRGPWARGAWRAFKYMRPLADFAAIASADESLELKDIATRLTAKDSLREDAIQSLLSPDWERRIRDRTEMDYRNSLDRILETLTLVELAIEAAYLREATVRQAVRRVMLDLFWPEGVRQFVINYGYINILTLASRMRLDFISSSKVTKVPTFEKAETRFATFLAEHQQWYYDPELTAWLNFLDGYRHYSGEQEGFAEFLRTGRPSINSQNDRQFVTLLAGLERFCTYLTDLFGLLREEERPYFGVIYTHIMARFVGHRMSARGFERDLNDFNWAEELKASPFASATGGVGAKDLRFASDCVLAFLKLTSEFVADLQEQRISLGHMPPRIAPRLASAQPAPRGAVPSGQKETAASFYEKGDVRIRYQEVGSGFPLLVTPGGGLNSRISSWLTAVFNAPEAFKNDFRCITMDQRNANGGESTGPVPVDDPWGAFADDQLGLMDHLGIREFSFMGYDIGGPFALKLIERAPDRVLAAVLCQMVGHRPDDPDVMYRSGRDVWAPELLARRPDLNMETIEKYLHNLYRVRPDFVYSVSRDFAHSCRTPMLVLPDDTPAHPFQTSVDVASLAPNAELTVFPWREPPELLAKTINRVRNFLKAHQLAKAVLTH